MEIIRAIFTQNQKKVGVLQFKMMLEHDYCLKLGFSFPFSNLPYFHFEVLQFVRC